MISTFLGLLASEGGQIVPPDGPGGGQNHPLEGPWRLLETACSSGGLLGAVAGVPGGSPEGSGAGLEASWAQMAPILGSFWGSFSGILFGLGF